MVGEVDAGDYARLLDRRRRMLCRIRTAYLIKRGKITRTPCIDCGSPDEVDAHHLNYDDPFAVVFACVRCHRNRHAREARVATNPLKGTPRLTIVGWKGDLMLTEALAEANRRSYDLSEDDEISADAGVL